MASRYWVGGGSSTNWNATGNTNWAATSGGANNETVPGATDDVFFDANSGSGTSTLSADISIQSLDMNGFTGTLAWSTNSDLTIAGNGVTCRFASGMTITYGSNTFLLFTGTSGTTTLTTAGKLMTAITINGAGGTVQLGDAITQNLQTDTLTLTAGTFDANDFAVTISNFSSANTNTRTISMGSGLWTITRATGSNSPWSLSVVTNLTFNKETADILVSGTGRGAFTFAGGGLTYNDVTFAGAAGGVARGISISGANTFATLEFQAPLLVTLAANQTVTQLVAAGSSSAYIGFISNDANTSRTISQAAGSVAGDRLILQSITGAGGATFEADNSIDLGSNTGWTITAPSAGGGGGTVIVMHGRRR